MAHHTPESRTLATRTAGLATNVLATGLILILGAAGGRHAVHWWSAARPKVESEFLAEVIGPDTVAPRGPNEAAANEPVRHLLAFGDDALLASRTELHGDTHEVLARLRDDCRAIADKTERVDRSLGPAEQQMLERIKSQTPVESTSRWRMYQIDAPLPMVVTVLDQTSVQAADHATAADVSATASRVVSWGVAFPAVSDAAAPRDRWTLFTLTADNPQLGPLATLRALPVPPRCQRTISLQAESGAIMAGFRGRGSIQQAQSFYDGQLGAPGWTPASSWRHDGSTWQRSFTSLRGGRLDVQLIEEANGVLNGFLMSAPRVRSAPDNVPMNPRRNER